MDTRASGAVRWARATVLGVVVLTLGAVAHVQGDGHVPGPVGMGFLGLLTIAACAAWLGRPAGALRIVVITTLGQAGVHLLLSLTAGHAGAPSQPTASPGPAQPPFGPSAAPSGVTTADQLDLGPLLHVFSDMAAHGSMAVAHLVAAVAVGLWLSVGERSLWTLVALAARQLLAPVALLAAAVLPRPVAVRRGPPRPLTTTPPRLAALNRVVVRRGPPALLLA